MVFIWLHAWSQEVTRGHGWSHANLWGGGMGKGEPLAVLTAEYRAKLPATDAKLPELPEIKKD